MPLVGAAADNSVIDAFSGADDDDVRADELMMVLPIGCNVVVVVLATGAKQSTSPAPKVVSSSMCSSSVERTGRMIIVGCLF